MTLIQEGRCARTSGKGPSAFDRGTSLIRNTPLLGPCSRTIPRVLCWSQGGGLFLMSEVLLFPHGALLGFR